MKVQAVDTCTAGLLPSAPSDPALRYRLWRAPFQMFLVRPERALVMLTDCVFNEIGITGADGAQNLPMLLLRNG